MVVKKSAPPKKTASTRSAFRKKAAQKQGALTADLKKANQALQTEVAERKRAEDTARRSMELFQRLLESVPDGMVIVNAHHEIVMINDNIIQLTGFTRRDLYSQPVEKLVPEKLAINHVVQRNSYMQDPKARPMGAHLKLFCRRKDGTQFPVEVSLSPLKTDEGSVVIASVRDSTMRARVESTRGLAEAVFANTTEGIVVTDEKGTIQSVNEAFVQITGYSKSEAVGKTPQILKSGLQDAGFYAWMWKTLQETGMWKGNFWNRRKNGDLYPQETTINAIRNEHGEIVLYCGIFRDVTEQYKLEETLRMLSTTDGLTGLANRRTFDETIATEWRRSQRVGYSIATIMADIDNFKSYNDTYGHLEGDDCLKKVAQVFQAAVRRAGDLAARYGGEEFVLLLPMTKTNEAAHIAEEIRRKVEALGILHEHSDASPVVTISMGVAAVVPTQDMSVEDLIALADQALYQAKREGKNCARRVND